MGVQIRESLERKLHEEEDLIFLDFASVKRGIFRRPAFLALTSQRFFLFHLDLFQPTEVVSIPWPASKSFRVLPKTKGILHRAPRLAELTYQTPEGEAKIQFSVGRSGAPDKTETLCKNLSLRFQIQDKEIYTVADTVVVYSEGRQQHTRLRRWVFDLLPDPEGAGVLALLTNEAVMQQRLHNLLYLDLEGEVRWRAELPTAKGVPDSYLRIGTENGNFYGFTWSGLSCELDRETGGIIRLKRITKEGSPSRGRDDLEVSSPSGEYLANLLFAGEDRHETRLYRLFIEPALLFKERVFGPEIHWSPDGRYLAVQEIFLNRTHGVQSVGIVLFDLHKRLEALVEKSISRSFIPQGWNKDGLLQYGKGLITERGESKEIGVDKVFWLPLQT